MPHLWERCAGVGMTVTIPELGIDSVQVFDCQPSCRAGACLIQCAGGGGAVGVIGREQQGNQ